jgi:integrase
VEDTKTIYQDEGRIMGSCHNPNAPAKGTNVTVEPIRDLETIRTITENLKSHPRNLLLFVLGVNNGLRVVDLLKLKVKQVRDARVGEIVRIKESKTGKPNILVINASVHNALQIYLQSGELSGEDYLFKSSRGQGAIKKGLVNKLIKRWTASVNLRGRYGCASLRKSWGYIQRTVHGVGFEVIAKRFNHSSPAVTMRYLGIQDQEVYKSLMNEIA